MKYLYTTKTNHDDFSSGKVLYSAPGMTSYPVRLASEIFQRCARFLRQQGIGGPYSLLDPCCGSAYMLTVLGFLHGTEIREMYASDLDERALDIAGKNLSLLTRHGLDRRIAEIRRLYELYRKPSHREAIASAERLRQMLSRQNRTIDTYCFRADALSEDFVTMDNGRKLDIVITDVPYGRSVKWETDNANCPPVERLLENLGNISGRPSVAAISADKSQKLTHDRFRRIGYFKIGIRHVALFDLR